MDSYTREFIKENYSKLGISKKFIRYSEIIEIKEKYNLNESILLDVIDEGNDKYIL